MARTKGPLFSLAAQGTFADKLTSSSWKGRTYTKIKSAPTGTPTLLQTYLRNQWGFLSQQWTPGLTDSDRATWNALAAESNTLPINAYLKENTASSSLNFQPHTRQGATPSASLPFFSFGPTLSPGVKQFTLNYQIGLINQCWGFFCVGLLTTPPGPLQAVFQIFPADTTGAFMQVPYTKVLPGNWDVDVNTFSRTGFLSTINTFNVDVLP